jgi:hypothetical protein
VFVSRRQPGAEPDDFATRLPVNGGLRVAAPQALLSGISSRPEVLLKVLLSHMIGDLNSTKAEKKWRSTRA